MYDRDVLKKMQVRFESRRRFPYDDSTGKPPDIEGKITIGVGWNLTDNGLPSKMIDELHELAIEGAERILLRDYPWWGHLDDVRQMAMVDMVFNLGPLKFSKFKGMISMMSTGAYLAAAKAARNSLWYQQVKSRGVVITSMIETGQMPVDA